MKISNQIVMNPRGVTATTLVAAASRGGARGFLNTAGYDSYSVIQADVDAILDVIENPIGIRLTPHAAKWITELTSSLTSQWQWAIVSEFDWPEWPRWIEALERLGIEILIEVTRPAQFERATALNVDGVLLRGSEASEKIGDLSAFMLLQEWNQFCDRETSAGHRVRGVSVADIPFWVQGGIGPNTASGCYLAGATGVVLDSQMLLCRESPLGHAARRTVAAMDGSETRVVGQQLGHAWRLCPSRGSDIYERLVNAEENFLADGSVAPDMGAGWDTIVEQVATESHWDLMFVGQDIALAKSMADQFVTVSGVLQAICHVAVSNVDLAERLRPLAPGATLAASHGTEFPILQGPMTRVSDTAQFAAEVSRGGGLPFLALALMRGIDVDRLLVETAKAIADRPWGVGLLGFLPPEIRREQTEVILRHKPPYAIIAGGRPDQARELEREGIPTYLHVPSPGLLRRFLKDGARRFIFEGRECGGHVGPRSSFLLWETMVGVLLDHIGSSRGTEYHIVFAGGIHDANSAAMVATVSARLAERGVGIGLLMGTAYLFTQEAVAAGAIVDRFQQEALSANETVLFETGPGHAVRCLRTPYYGDFLAEKIRLRKAGKSHDELVKSLEMMNIGRLRVASKGLDRVATESEGLRELKAVDDQEQLQRGMYMIGQVAALRDRPTTIADLHAEVSASATERIEDFAICMRDEADGIVDPPNPCDIAIVGMACYYPGANSLGEYWENILRLQYDVIEVPGTHWDWRPFYDPDPRARDKIVSKWGGFLGEIPFDPLRYGITPKSMLSIEPLQLLLLECVRTALCDAGYERRPFNRERTAAILGVGGGGSPLAVAYGFRSCLPLLDNLDTLPVKSNDILDQAKDFLPEWTEDSFPGFLLNVAVGRIANRFDFGGSNYAIDAACASSLAAVHACVRELEQGTADVAVAMGADTVQTPFAFMAFSKTHALSPQGRCRPFDADADGIVLSEGIGAVILKRLEDAERDGDTIYAVVRGVGASSDGKDKGLTAPNEAGQIRALRRAYQKAGIAASRVGLIEAHGTGTVVGDRTEAAALARVLVESGADGQSCALGSVKSLIGHSKCAAGIAGLIKTAKALHHRILPPTLVESPNPQVVDESSPLYLNREPRPWVQEPTHPRVAGVSAFGFGGTNVHLVLEEYTNNLAGQHSQPPLRDWPTEVFVWRGERAAIKEALTSQRIALQDSAQPRLAEYASSLWRATENHAHGPTDAVLAIVAGNQNELIDRMEKASAVIEGEKQRSTNARGIYFAAGSERLGQVAFLFPGQGAQYPNMAADAAMNFDEVRSALDLVTGELRNRLGASLAQVIYPPSVFDEAQATIAAKRLAQTNHAQPAIGAVSLGLLRLLRRLGVEPDVVGGHSYGEFVALHAAGVIGERDLARLSLIRGELMRTAAEKNPGGMAAVAASQKRVAELVGDVPELTLANLNAPEQTVISACHDVLNAAMDRLKAEDVRVTRLDVACAFHSPAVASAGEPLSEELDRLHFRPASIPVYSNTTGEAHSADPQTIKRVMAEHLASPVRFVDQIQAMYAEGVRVFVEVGPQRQLSGLVRRILADQPHETVAMDVKGRSGVEQIQHCLAQLLCAGVPVDLTPLFERRVKRTFDPRRLAAENCVVEHSKNTWMVNGVRSRLWNAPEPKLLGQKWADVDPERPFGQPTSPTSEPADAAGSQSPAPKSRAPKSARANASTTDSGRIPDDLKSHQTLTHHPVSANPKTVNAAFTPQNQPKSAPTAERVVMDKPMNPTSDVPPETATMKSQLSHDPSSTSAETVGEVESVMLGFQQLMMRFLETQQAVMHHYLTGETVEFPTPSSLRPTVATTAKTQPMSPTRSAAQASVDSSKPVVPNVDADVERPTTVEPPKATPSPMDAIHRLPTGGIHLKSDGNGANTSPRPKNGEPPEPTLSEPNMSMDDVSAKLIELVSDRTGYPEDMLDPDLDLEGDLGIDSIKRVEILGDLAEVLGISEESNESGIELEKLTTIRSLQGILDYLKESLFKDSQQIVTNVAANAQGGASEATSQDSANGERLSSNGRKGDATHSIEGTESSDFVDGSGEANGQRNKTEFEHINGNGATTEEVQRGLIRLVPAPMERPSGMPIPAGAIVITDDGRGVAVQLVERFADFGQSVVLLRSAEKGVTLGDGIYAADLEDEADVERVLSEIRQRVGRIAGLIHAMPLASHCVATGQEQWLTRARRDTKSFFLLCRGLLDDLDASAKKGLSFVLAPTSLGGGLGFADPSEPDEFHAGQGGVLGFAKCLAQETNGVLIRGVDFPSDAETTSVCDALLAELSTPDGPFEVGYQNGQRMTWLPVAGELDASVPQIRLDADSVILLTGGARGITSAIAIELAKRYQCHLVLVGRSPVPSAESGDTVGLESAAELKAALIAKRQTNGKDVVPSDVEHEFQSIRRNREIRSTIAEIRSAGSKVTYDSLDVRDEAALATLINKIRKHYGRLDGVIHGAGVIEDKLIRDKTSESFDRVFDTKVKSAWNIRQHVAGDDLQFCVFFASVASRYGNKGQADYAAANEVLAKLAVDLDRRWAARVVAIDWGPWSSIGMVSHLEKHLAKRGVTLISPADGTDHLLRELVFGMKGETEVIIAGGAERLAVPQKLLEFH